MDDLLEDLIMDENFNVLTGDFNIDLNKKTNYSDKILSLFNQYNLDQIMNESTRVNNRSQTLIDYTLTIRNW
jgi:hypothetical protein